MHSNWTNKCVKVFQFNLNLELIAEYESIIEAQYATGISHKTISSAMIEGHRCHRKWFFSRSIHMEPKREYIDEPLTHKIMLTLPESLGEDFLSVIGQRNKQDILRNLIRNWVDKEMELKKQKK
jgi:hypothetical protein